MKSDVIQTAFTYLTAYTIVVAGFIFLYAVRSDQSAQGTVAIVAGFIGAAITFLFSSATATRATAAAAASTAVGVGMTPTTTVSSGPPVTVTTTPAQPEGDAA